MKSDNYQGKAITMPSICAIQRIGEDEYLYEARDYASNAIGLAYVKSLLKNSAYSQ